MEKYVICIAMIACSNCVLAQETDTEQRIIKLTTEAKEHFVENRFPEAITLYKQAMNLGLGMLDGNSLFFFAQCQFMTGEFEKAKKNFTALTNAYPDDHPSFFWLARCHRQSGDLIQAIKCLCAAMKTAALQNAEEDIQKYALDLRADCTEVSANLLQLGMYQKALSMAYEAERWHQVYSPGKPYPDAMRIIQLAKANLKPQKTKGTLTQTKRRITFVQRIRNIRFRWRCR